ncbi:hypothetical protein [Rhodocyclus tenuis]|uniref:Uncharacterized protein n=1 Tax=Rhodocyclus tenuis TaxID=1066 RepID=A0A840G379_RHOTE|nr:hypothetical protein [Rhodocyclus tenuis]MBB4248857.1 hypothetical protein [Rhodocyclus tenuis]
MWLLRLLAVITAILIAGSALAWLLTREPRYLWLTKRLFIFALLAALIFLALLALERIAVIPL